MEASIVAINNYSQKRCSNTDIKDIIDAFRFLRNSCASNPGCQAEIGENNDIVLSTLNVLTHFVSADHLNDDEILCLVIGIQFLANFLVNNKDNQNKVWSCCQDLFDKCLIFNNEKVQHCCLMILYNIFLGSDDILNSIPQSFEIVFELATKDNASEYALFLTDLFINNLRYLKNFYNDLSLESKLLILEEAERLVNNSDENVFLSPVSLKFFSQLFSKKADTILNKLKEQTDNFNVAEVVKLLDILTAGSSNDGKKYLGCLQEETSFFINCITLLKAVHMLSKEKNNVFTAETKMSEFQASEDDMLKNPIVGFKSNLVRIIGNLCWKNKKYQDIVRDLECVQVILDCCVIDRKNPFITQWSIFAIHNICENNLENQQVIAQLSKEGVISAESLSNVGIVLNQSPNEGYTLHMAPLQLKK